MGESAAVPPSSAPTIALLLLVKLRNSALPWGLSRLVLGERGLMPRAPGLRFMRVLGSGRDGGFGLVPGFDHQGLIGFFDEEAQARAFAADSPVMHAYRQHAHESITAVLRATASRGQWGGVSLTATAQPLTGAPMATLTRASIRLRHVAHFWRHAPATHEGIAHARGCRLAIGLGEAPLLRQATFSLWDNTQAMEDYARSGAHHAASHGARREGWFSESMFVRFTPLSLAGQWRGQLYG